MRLYPTAKLKQYDLFIKRHRVTFLTLFPLVAAILQFLKNCTPHVGTTVKASFVIMETFFDMRKPLKTAVKWEKHHKRTTCDFPTNAKSQCLMSEDVVVILQESWKPVKDLFI